MSRDRFRDLTEGRDRPSAAERLSELDSRDERAPEPPPGRPGGPSYAWVVGVAALIAIAVATYVTLGEGGTGEGFRGPERGEPLPEFAAPSATGSLDGDANVIQREDASPESTVPPACEVRGPGVVRVCSESSPVVITFVTDGCESQLDSVEAIRDEFRAVRFIGVYSDQSREQVAELVRSRGWRFEVAVDPDLPEVFNLYRAGDCPTTVLAGTGGDIVATRNGPLPDEELRAAVAEVAPHGGRG